MDDYLLRAHWLATQHPITKDWKGIASIKIRFDRTNYISGEMRLVPAKKRDEDQAAAWDRLYKEVCAYVKSLLDCSFFLAEMFDPEAEFEAFDTEQSKKEARLRSSALRRSGVVAPYRPLLLAARLAYPTDGMFYSQLVDLCERYTARVFVIEQRRSNAGVSRLFRLANDLYKRKRDRDEVLFEMRATLWGYAPDERVRTTMESTSENWYARRGHKYFLYEYERSLMAPGEELPPLASFTEASKEQRTTEHILPQHPETDAACWWDHFSEEEHASLCHALGNLALTLDNSSYSNKCFDAKRGKAIASGEEPARCYAQGKLHQERQLAQYDGWTLESIRARQVGLADWALERWAVEPPHLAEAPHGDVDIEDEATEEDMVALHDR